MRRGCRRWLVVCRGRTWFDKGVLGLVIVFVVVVGLETSRIQLSLEPVLELSIFTSVVGSGDDHSKSLM